MTTVINWIEASLKAMELVEKARAEARTEILGNDKVFLGKKCNLLKLSGRERRSVANPCK